VRRPDAAPDAAERAALERSAQVLRDAWATLGAG